MLDNDKEIDDKEIEKKVKQLFERGRIEESGLKAKRTKRIIVMCGVLFLGGILFVLDAILGLSFASQELCYYEWFGWLTPEGAAWHIHTDGRATWLCYHVSESAFAGPLYFASAIMFLSAIIYFTAGYGLWKSKTWGKRAVIWSSIVIAVSSFFLMGIITVPIGLTDTYFYLRIAPAILIEPFYGFLPIFIYSILVLIISEFCLRNK